MVSDSHSFPFVFTASDYVTRKRRLLLHVSYYFCALRVTDTIFSRELQNSEFVHWFRMFFKLIQLVFHVSIIVNMCNQCA